LKIVIPSDPQSTDFKGGSHNLVVWAGHTYGSFGGIVAGYNDLINGEYASVTGGEDNLAIGERSSVSGGNINQTIGIDSSVSSVSRNEANGSTVVSVVTRIIMLTVI
jgi:hypothetical protein